MVILLSEILVFLGIFSSRWMAMIFFPIFVALSIINIKDKDTIKWACLFIMGLFIFSTIANKPVLDVQSVLGFTSGFILGGLYILFSASKTERKVKDKIMWFSILFIFVILVIMFLGQYYRNFVYSLGIILAISISIGGPEFKKKIGKD